jgi:16S rRNA (cytosine1402-N4)-methyltransferase
MLREVIEALHPEAGDNFIDCTLGGAGYTIELAKRVLPGGKILSIDLDSLAIQNAKDRLEKEKLNNVIIVQDNFRNITKVVQKNWLEGGASFSGIVLDLGLSSAHLDDRKRGFSFQFDTPLKMEFGETEETTEEIVNTWNEKDLFRVIRDYGEEKYAYKIAQAIVNKRKEKEIKTTGELVEIIGEAVPAFYKRKKIHFATKTFQALRMATNGELDSLEEVLPQALDLLAPGGRLVVVSFHSLEDRIVKNFFRGESKDCLCPKQAPICQCNHKKKLNIITRKSLMPTQEEIKMNPRARSAKMRVAEKI